MIMAPTCSAVFVANKWQYCLLIWPPGCLARKQNCLQPGSQVAYDTLLSPCAINTSWKKNKLTNKYNSAFLLFIKKGWRLRTVRKWSERTKFVGNELISCCRRSKFDRKPHRVAEQLNFKTTFSFSRSLYSLSFRRTPHN